jgi:GNAT superfamily N-acetyltransferase
MLRRARPEDAEAVADVFVRAFAGLTFLPALHTEDETRGWIATTMLPTHEVWVAEVEGEIVGFAALTDELLGHMYVHPSAQGRGIGSALLEKAKERRPRGFDLWVFQQNEGARRFYERHGLECVELTDGAENEERTPDARYVWRPAD